MFPYTFSSFVLDPVNFLIHGLQQKMAESNPNPNSTFGSMREWVSEHKHRTLDAILRHDIYDRTPSLTWGKGRVTLLGDSIHVMQPNLGQGGCMAIEIAFLNS